MAKYQTNEFRSGLKVMIDKDPCTIIDNEFVKPGKGQAFNRVKLRNLITQRVLERTFKSGESVQAADILEVECEYLYQDGQAFHFMDPKNFEQQAVADNVVGDVKYWLKEQGLCVVTLFNSQPILVTAPNFVELKVVQTAPGLKGDTVSGATKQACLETGAVIRVPLFIEEGETLKIDTRTGEYISRVKS